MEVCCSCQPQIQLLRLQVEAAHEREQKLLSLYDCFLSLHSTPDSHSDQSTSQDSFLRGTLRAMDKSVNTHLKSLHYLKIQALKDFKTFQTHSQTVVTALHTFSDKAAVIAQVQEEFRDIQECLSDFHHILTHLELAREGDKSTSSSSFTNKSCNKCEVLHQFGSSVACCGCGHSIEMAEFEHNIELCGALREGQRQGQKLQRELSQNTISVEKLKADRDKARLDYNHLLMVLKRVKVDMAVAQEKAAHASLGKTKQNQSHSFLQRVKNLVI